MYQSNPSHNGFIPVSLDPTKFALHWVKNLGSRPSAVTIAGGHAFVASDQSLYSLDPSSGDNFWSADYGSSSSSDTVAAETSPGYSDGKVYIETASDVAGAYLCAYDAATGALLFNSSVGPGDRNANFYAPTIFDRKIYIQGIWADGDIYSLDGSWGNKDWSVAQSQYGGAAPAVDENWVYSYTGYCPQEINATGYNILYVADRLTGRLVFQVPDFTTWSGPAAYTPVLGGLSDVFVISSEQLVRFDLNARNISWANSGAFMYQPAVANGVVYAIGDGALGAYDQTTGTLLWTWKVPNYDNVQGTIVVTKSHLFVTSTFNTYCIDLNTHQAVWSYPAAGQLSLGESTLYISCWDGTLTAISLGIPDIYVPETVDFGSADSGGTLTRTIPVTNVGDAPLEVQSILSSSEEFVVQSLVLPITIGPRQSVPVAVQFTPGVGETGSANLVVSSTVPDEPEITAALKVRWTITASANEGGTVSPSGNTSVLDGDSFTFVVTPDPGYQLASLVLDGVNVPDPSTSVVTYTFDNVVTDHTITAVFAHYLDFFGIQAGNTIQSLITYTNGATAAETENITFDTGTSSFLDTAVASGTQLQSWTQVSSTSFLLQKQVESGMTVTYAPPMAIVNAPLAAKMSWTSNTTATESGISVKERLVAKVSPMVLVNVPAGFFMAWPIAYTSTASAGGRAASTNWTTWFAPYIGTVKNKDSNSTSVLTSFSVGAGTVSTPPPVIAGVLPASAAIGSQVTVNGYQFGASQGSSTVRIGSVECEAVSWSDTQIRFIVPDAASPGAVTVTTDIWTSNDSVKLNIPPQITGVNPSSGKRGATVQIEGTNFGTVQGKVELDSTQVKVTQWANSSISFTVPATMPYGSHSAAVINSQGKSVLHAVFTVAR
jgi:outer membrane protein assembly factor BamB